MLITKNKKTPKSIEKKEYNKPYEVYIPSKHNPPPPYREGAQDAFKLPTRLGDTRLYPDGRTEKVK